MERIARAVAGKFGITVTTLVTYSKKPPAPRARLVCYWLARALKLRLTDSEIYRSLGQKRTVIWRGIRDINELRETDPWYRSITDELLVELQAPDESARAGGEP